MFVRPLQCCERLGCTQGCRRRNWRAEPGVTQPVISDVDLLVDLDEGVSLVGLIGLERELAEILGGKVDVVPARNLKPGIVERVVAEAIEL